MKTKIILTSILLISTFVTFSQEVKPFQNNKGKWGLQNKKGKTIVKPKFDNILMYRDYSTVDSAIYYLVNIGGELRRVLHSDTLAAQDVNSQSGENSYSEELVYFEVKHIVGGDFGLKDSKGKTILKTKYSDLILPFWFQYEEERDQIINFISINSIHLSENRDFYEGYFKSDYPIIVCEDGKWGQMDFLGNQILETLYDSIDVYDDIRFYQNKVLAAITGVDDDIYFLADMNVVEESDYFIETFIKNNDRETDYTNYRNKIYFYFSNSKVEYTYLWDTVLVENPETWELVEYYVGNEVPFICHGKIKILNNNGKEITNFAFDDIYLNKSTFDYNTGDETGNVYINIKADKDIIINERVDFNFMELASNIVVVKKDNKFGVIDLATENLIELKYDSFTYKYNHDGLEISLYTNNVLNNIIDSNGKEIFSYSEEDVKNSNASLELNLKSSDNLNDSNEQLNNVIFLYFSNVIIDSIMLYDTLYNYYDEYFIQKTQIPVFSNGNITIVNKSGYKFNDEAYDEVYYYVKNNEFVDYSFSYQEPGPFIYTYSNTGKFISVKTSNDDIYENKQIYIDGIPDIHFNNLIALKNNDWFLIDLKTKKTKKIDPGGDTLNLISYDKISFLKNGYLIVQLNRKIGFLNKSYEKVQECRFDQIDKLNNDLYRTQLNFKVAESDNIIFSKFGLINMEGKELLECKYSFIGKYHDSLAKIQLLSNLNDYNGIPIKGKSGFIDMAGNIVIECKYDRVGDFFNGLAIVRKDSKSGFVDQNGAEVIPCQFDYVENFYNELAIVVMDGKYGFINLTGKKVIPCIYDYAKRFDNGKAKVSKGKEEYLINKKGERIFE
ncbi:WG repeat-containing protein [Bacteroidota bacterium]